MKILVTGAGGFVGGAISATLEQLGHYVVRVFRSRSAGAQYERYERAVFGDLMDDHFAVSCLGGISVVIHCAAEVHGNSTFKFGDSKNSERFKFNVQGTANLAEKAASAGVKRFIFLSTVGISLGTNDSGGVCLSHLDKPNPNSDYAQSKLWAEEALKRTCLNSGMEFVNLRAPAVYGPGAKGKLRLLKNLVLAGIPLPFGSLNDARSFIGIDNLVDAIITSIFHPNAGMKTILICDGNDLSLADFVRIMATSVDKKARLLPIPKLVLLSLGALFGKRSNIGQSIRSLRIDNRHALETMQWAPPFSVEEGVEKWMNG